MNTWEQRMTSRRPRLLHLDLVATLFRVQGTSRRAMRCAVYRVETGLELRLECEDCDDLLRSELFKFHDDEAIAELADRWHLALREKGFSELPVFGSVIDEDHRR